MKTHWIREMSWVEFDQRRKETNTVIIPTGACEIYGPHLPMGSDGFAAAAVAERVAERTGALIAPMTEIADSGALLDYPGTITVSTPLYRMWMEELIDNLIGYGFKNLMFISGHATNVGIITSLMIERQRTKGINWAQIDWWRFTAVHGDDIFDCKGRMAHGHASECGTSVMLYLKPELVHMEKATCVAPLPETSDYPDIVHFVPMKDKTPDATVGDATCGTREKGEKIVNRCVDRIVEYMNAKWEL